MTPVVHNYGNTRFRADRARVSVNDMNNDIARPLAEYEPPTRRLIDANALLVDLGAALALAQRDGAPESAGLAAASQMVSARAGFRSTPV
jgi:hypothetical protein